VFAAGNQVMPVQLAHRPATQFTAVAHGLIPGASA
jgi:hypothetical protein